MPSQSIEDLNNRAGAIMALEPAYNMACTKCGGVGKFCAKYKDAKLRPDALCHWFAKDRDRRVPDWPNIKRLGRALVEGRFLSKKDYAQACGEPYAKN